MKNLVKNPLGIIALFISLIYGFANLLLGATASALGPDERFLLIGFIVLFPVLVLAIFYALVACHHFKLYSPGDYKDDKSFLHALSQEEREQKLYKEAEEVLPEQTNVEVPQTPDGVEVNPPSPKAGISYIRDELRLIESLAISKFESEFKLRADRDVAIGDTGVSFDAVFQTGGILTFLEIKSLRHASSTTMLLDRVLCNALLADRFLNSNFKLILAVVYSFDKASLPRIENVWQRRLEKFPAAVQLRFISRAELGA